MVCSYLPVQLLCHGRNPTTWLLLTYCDAQCKVRLQASANGTWPPGGCILSYYCVLSHKSDLKYYRFLAIIHWQSFTSLNYYQQLVLTLLSFHAVCALNNPSITFQLFFFLLHSNIYLPHLLFQISISKSCLPLLLLLLQAHGHHLSGQRPTSSPILISHLFPAFLQSLISPH